MTFETEIKYYFLINITIWESILFLRYKIEQNTIKHVYTMEFLLKFL